MKMFFCLWLGLIIVSCGFLEEDYNSDFSDFFEVYNSDFLPEQSFTYPDKNLGEIQLSGDYSVSGIKEKFEYRGIRYCYYTTKPKKDTLDKNLRARLYDKDGNILTEDFLRTSEIFRTSTRINSYLPYDDNGHEIRIVRLKDNKEITIETIEFLSEAQLKDFNEGIGFNPGWYFRGGRAHCFIPPPYR